VLWWYHWWGNWGATGAGGTGNGDKGAGLVGGIRGSGPDCAAGQTGVYVGHCWGTAKKGDEGRWELLGVEVISKNVRKYSSSACVNLHVAATNGLSPETSRGSGEWTKVAGAVGGLATG